MNDEAKKAKAEKLLNALNDTDDEMIIAASQQKKSAKRRLPLWCGIGAAAVLAVGGIAAGVILNRDPGELLPPVDPSGTLTADENLPKIPAETVNGAFGFEGIMVPDITDFATNNPWSAEQNIKVMPVYKNRVACNQGGAVITDADYDTVTSEIKALLIENAARLGVTLTESDITDNGHPKDEWEKVAAGYEEALREPVPKGYFIPQTFTAVTDEYKIQTDCDFTTSIFFTEPVDVPVDLNATDHDKAVEAAEYLLEEYSGLLNMAEPEICIKGGDYYYDNYGGRSPFEISFYDASGTPEQDIENYFMNYVRFYGNDEGKLWIIRIYRFDLAAELIGNYPLITPEEAEEMLKNGEYATSAPVEDGWKPDSFGRVELVYRAGRVDKYFIPYYKFWVDISDVMLMPGEYSSENRTYVALYIPAVEPQYIEDVPTYDGRFN